MVAVFLVCAFVYMVVDAMNERRRVSLLLFSVVSFRLMLSANAPLQLGFKIA